MYMWKLAASDCPRETQYYVEEIEKLKSMTDIRSNVIQDFNAIHEKLPCIYSNFVS